MRTPARLALLVPGGLVLLAGLDAALLLLGLPAPVTTERLPQVHGALLVLGFVGTLIALERAVALRRWWGFLAPGLLGLGALLVVSPAPLAVGQGLMVAGAAAQLGVYAGLWRRQGSAALALQVLGAVLAAGAALLWWAGVGGGHALPWFVGYVVLTIAGERLELARVGFLSASAERAIAAAGFAVFAAVTGTVLWPDVATPLLGVAVLALVGLLLVHDVARRTVRSTGLPRYIAWCLLAGYVWLAVAGGVWALLGPVTEGPAYDAAVHAVFLGFTLSMIMAHAPVILPAVLGIALPYSPAMAAPVVLLHASLALRVVGGDLYGQTWALTTGGALNIAAVLLFAALAVRAAVLGARRGGGATGGRPTGPVVGASAPDPVDPVDRPVSAEAAR